MFDEIPISTIELPEGRFQTFPDIRSSKGWFQVRLRKEEALCAGPATLSRINQTNYRNKTLRATHNIESIMYDSQSPQDIQKTDVLTPKYACRG